MSDLTLHTFYTDDAALFITTDIITPLRGTGSLQVQRGSVGANMSSIRNSGSRAFTSGRIRWLAGQGAGGALGDRLGGMCFNMSQADLTGGVGTAYWVYVDRPGSGATIVLRRLIAGLAGGSALIATSAGFTWALAPLSVPLEVRWVLETSPAVRILITVKTGAVDDYSVTLPDWDTLPVVINSLQTTTVLQTTVGEGPVCNVGGGTATYMWDAVECVPLLVGG